MRDREMYIVSHENTHAQIMSTFVGAMKDAETFTVDPGVVETEEELLAPLRKAQQLDDMTVRYNAFKDTRCPIINEGLEHAGVNDEDSVRRFVFNQTHVEMNMQAPSADKAGFRICKTFPTYMQLVKTGVVPSVEELEAGDDKLRKTAMLHDPAARYANKMNLAERRLNINQWFTWSPLLLGTKMRNMDYCNKKVARIIRAHQQASVDEFAGHDREVSNYKANVQVGFEEERVAELSRLIIKKQSTGVVPEGAEDAGVEFAPTKMTVLDPKTGIEMTRSNKADDLKDMTAEEIAKLRAEKTTAGGVVESKSSAGDEEVMPTLSGIEFPVDEETTVDYINNLPKAFRDETANIAIVSIIEDITGEKDVEHVVVVYSFLSDKSQIEAELARIRHWVRLFRVQPVALHEWVSPHKLLDMKGRRVIGATRTQRMISTALNKGREFDKKQQEETRAEARRIARETVDTENEAARVEEALVSAGGGELTAAQEDEMDEAMKEFLAAMA